ncbi:alpha/beta hydrolase [Pseudomonas caspiana]|uniref:alpha/beta fold hydrolase n=1 Tax=Pseudomonas caspiana TaxID=1451454 RepID=UPI0032EE67C2
MNWPGQLVLLALRKQTRFRHKLKIEHWKADGYQIAYLQSNGFEAGPTLVFLHGLGASKDQWGTQIYSLADAYNCIFLDLPGEGESSFDSAQNYSPEDQVERLKAFFDALPIKGVILIGSSIGGCIACLYAATYPAEVSHLIAMSPAGLPAAKLSPAMKQYFESGTHPFGYRTVREMQAFWEIVFTHTPKIPGFLAKALAINGELRHEKVGKILRDFERTGLYPLPQRLAEVQARTLILWGNKDRVFDISCIDEIDNLLPHASVCIIEGAGHIPYLECGEQTLDAIHRFLER